MKRSRSLIATGYGLAALLLILPLLEPVVSLLPPRPGQIYWRLQAFGAFSHALLLPQVGGVVAVGTAVLLGQRAVVRALSLLAVVTGLALATAAGLFVLDLLEYSGTVEPALREYYLTAGVIYFVAFVLSAAFVLWLAAVAWRAARHSRRKSIREDERQPQR